MRPEPDYQAEAVQAIKDALGQQNEGVVYAEHRITWIDRLLGFDQQLIDVRGEGDPYVDSRVLEEYFSIKLEKPFGMDLIEIDPDDFPGGVEIGQVKPTGSAFKTGLIREGWLLIGVDNEPVYDWSFDDVVDRLSAAPGPVKLTIFKGDARFFYGDYSPGEEWLTGFFGEMNRLKELGDEMWPPMQIDEASPEELRNAVKAGDIDSSAVELVGLEEEDDGEGQ